MRVFLVWRCASLFLQKSCYTLFLPFRHQGVLMFPLCSKCCVERNEDFCQHREKERALTGVWTTIEIDRAIKLGYRLTIVTEVWHFKKRSDTPFSGFINALYRGKLEASGFPDGVTHYNRRKAAVHHRKSQPRRH